MSLPAKNLSAPLLLLRKIRDIMAAPETPQTRLDHLVAAIAQDFVSEVCSIYLTRPGDVLELYASVGLEAKAVHLTRLRIGEGLVGTIAAQGEPLNLAEAQKHPAFVYRPETGEEIYHSFVGVPILHSQHVLGVLVVQGMRAEIYGADELEILQTVSMVLAEMIASGRMITLAELKEVTSESLETLHVTGQKLSPGLAHGPAVLHRPRIEIRNVVADNMEYEEKRLQAAIRELQDSVDLLVRTAARDQEQREIMEAYRMFTRDRGWLAQLGEAVSTGLTAEAAVKKVQDQLHVRMSQVSSEYIRERIQDLEDLSIRLIQLLNGEDGNVALGGLPDQFVLVAKTMGPAELLSYGNDRLIGIILEEGSASSHVAIIARAMEIPLVAQVARATERIQTGENLVVNGDSGEVFIRPSEEIEAEAAEQMRVNLARDADYASQEHLPAVTLDGIRISLNLNIGLIADPKHLAAEDIDGVGLYRSELPYMTAPDFPDVTSQQKIYAKILEQANGKPVIFRSFDIGGDKQVPYLSVGEEENPAMGWRATRIALDRPAIITRQFRAFIQATHGKALSVMFPFIAEMAEFDATKTIFDHELARAKEEGYAPSSIRIGTMIEIPSILFQLPQLMQKVDFVSIGSNDLLQFLFACDRGTQKVADRYDVLSPIVLDVVARIAAEGKKQGVEVGFCGEMARRPLEAMALLGVGIRTLSMPHSAVGPVKAMLRSIRLEEFAEYVDDVRKGPDHSIRGRLVEFVKDHKVPV